VCIWDVHEPHQPLELRAQDFEPGTIGVLADGRVVTGGINDVWLRVWDVQRPSQPVARIAIHVDALGVGPPDADGKQQLAIANLSGELALWDVSPSTAK
jgi:hypothetical protein